MCAPMKKKASLFNLYRGSRKARILFLLLLILPVLVVYVATVLLPGLTNPFEDAAPPKVTVEPKDKDAVLSASAEETPESKEWSQKLAYLERDEAFWNSQLQLAKRDSFNLLLDFSDSAAILQIKGVPVRKCKMHRFNIGYAIGHLTAQGGLNQWLSSPFILQREFATIPKAPIRIMQAPADTNEANATNSQEIPLENNDVHFTMEFDRNLTVTVEQVQRPTFKGRMRKALYDVRRSLISTKEILQSLKNLKMPHQRVWIEIEITREDAKAIYRALPQKAGLVMKL